MLANKAMYAAIAPPATTHKNSFTAEAHIPRNGNIVVASNRGLCPFDSNQSFRATVENVPVRVLPTVLNTVTAATEISAAIKAYSIEVAAVSLLRRLDSLASMAVARLSR